ncbi:hypothetical protein evm_009870 [Chilo suppressalis]|nr:hypothetical protein evm_009870 [Chilo suppressalis]
MLQGDISIYPLTSSFIAFDTPTTGHLFLTVLTVLRSDTAFIMEYASVVWSPQHKDMIEAVQRRMLRILSMRSG